MAQFQMFRALMEAGWKTPAENKQGEKTTEKPAAVSIDTPMEELDADPITEDLAADFLGDSNSESEDDFEDLLAEVTQTYSRDEALGEELPPAAANLANRALRAGISAQREKELTQKVLRHKNGEAFVVPRVNTEVWKAMQRKTRENDLAMQRIQGLLHKGLIPIVQVLSDLKSKKDKENLAKVLDAFQILAFGSVTLTNARKQAISLDLFPQYRPLCSAERAATDLLFGDDAELKASMKQLKDSQAPDTRLGYAAISKTPARGRGSFRGRGARGHTSARGHGKGPFRPEGLTKTQGAHPRGAHNQQPQGQHQSKGQ